MTADATVATALGELFGDATLVDRIAEIAADVRPERMRARAVITALGEPCYALVLRGAVKLVKGKVVLDVARAPVLVPLLWAAGRSSWDVVALRSSVVARVDRARLVEAAPAALAALEADRARSFAERIACRAAGTIEQRLERLLEDLTQRYGERVGRGTFIALPLRRHELASLVGATTETVSRIFAEWRRKGVVRASRDGIWWARLPA